MLVPCISCEKCHGSRAVALPSARTRDLAIRELRTSITREGYMGAGGRLPKDDYCPIHHHHSGSVAGQHNTTDVCARSLLAPTQSPRPAPFFLLVLWFTARVSWRGAPRGRPTCRRARRTSGSRSGAARGRRAPARMRRAAAPHSRAGRARARRRRTRCT